MSDTQAETETLHEPAASALAQPLVPPEAVPGSPGHRGRRLAGGVVLVLMGLSAAYSANAWGLRDRFVPPVTRLGDRSAAAPEVGEGPAVPDAPMALPAHNVRSQPWWQPVTTLEGTGDQTTEAFTIDDHALQWRVNWACTEGSLALVPVKEPGERLPRALAEASCPAEGTGYSVRTGRFALEASTAGSWQASVEQQLDVPMVEPPPPGIDHPSAEVLATGAMYDVDRVGEGRLRIVALPDGSRVLRLEDFFVSINSDLEIWFSEHPHPRTTPEAASAPHRQLEFLKATAGSMNYAIPDDLDLSRYSSVVIWCELTSNAYAAATLQG